MDDRDCLAFYPYVVVRIACRVCSRTGSYRLARLAAKFGPEISLRDLTDRFSYDCLWRVEARSKRGTSSCGVYLPDLEQPRVKGRREGGPVARRRRRGRRNQIRNRQQIRRTGARSGRTEFGSDRQGEGLVVAVR